ncbi:MAG: PfkB family carbohydrate kinase [Rectinemataceae bacterium]|nr:PfkB family carbohydrate kinase [Rectinemataceae bacterium]
MPKRFLVVCLNPVIQKTLVFDELHIDEVNRAGAMRTDASGKGVNVARVLTQMGAEAVHLTHAGGLNRDWFLSLCAAEGLPVEWVDSSSEVRICTTVIDSKAKTATELVEEAATVMPGTEGRLLERFDSLLHSFDVLVISGTKAAGYSNAVIPAMVRRATGCGLTVLLDIKGIDLVTSLASRPAVVKPNLSEFLATFPAPGGTGVGVAALRAHVHDYAKSWKERYGTELVVTRGNAPIWFEEGGSAAEEPTQSVQAINPTGSGDAFTAGLAYILSEGGSLREAIREGARLGALNAENLKPGSILREETA